MVKKFSFIIIFSYISSMQAMLGDINVDLLREKADKFITMLETSKSFEAIVPVITHIKNYEFVTKKDRKDFTTQICLTLIKRAPYFYEYFPILGNHVLMHSNRISNAVVSCPVDQDQGYKINKIIKMLHQNSNQFFIRQFDYDRFEHLYNSPIRNFGILDNNKVVQLTVDRYCEGGSRIAAEDTFLRLSLSKIAFLFYFVRFNRNIMPVDSLYGSDYFVKKEKNENSFALCLGIYKDFYELLNQVITELPSYLDIYEASENKTLLEYKAEYSQCRQKLNNAQTLLQYDTNIFFVQLLKEQILASYRYLDRNSTYINTRLN
jgi:hypothetical protein